MISQKVPLLCNFLYLSGCLLQTGLEIQLHFKTGRYTSEGLTKLTVTEIKEFPIQ